MPIQVEWYDEDGQEVVSDYFTAEEVAEKLKVIGASAIRERIRDGRWPALRVRGRVWMSRADIAHAMEELQSQTAPPLPTTAELGTPLSDVDAESIQ